MVTLKSDNLTDLWAQRLVKFFGWNTREQNKPLHKRTSKFYNPVAAGEESKDEATTAEEIVEHEKAPSISKPKDSTASEESSSIKQGPP